MYGYTQNPMTMNPMYQNPYQNRPDPMQQLYQMQSSTQNGLIRVTGLDGAKAYQMGPNSSIALFDANEDVFFVKSTDGAGFPTIRAFRFSPMESAPTQQGEYVTRQEFEELKGMILNGKQFVPESGTDTNVSTKPARGSKSAANAGAV